MPCEMYKSKLKYGLKELISASVWKKFSNLENYFDFYQYIYLKFMKNGTETIEQTTGDYR